MRIINHETSINFLKRYRMYYTIVPVSYKLSYLYIRRYIDVVWGVDFMYGGPRGVLSNDLLIENDFEGDVVGMYYLENKYQQEDVSLESDGDGDVGHGDVGHGDENELNGESFANINSSFNLIHVQYITAIDGIKNSKLDYESMKTDISKTLNIFLKRLADHNELLLDGRRGRNYIELVAGIYRKYESMVNVHGNGILIDIEESKKVDEYTAYIYKKFEAIVSKSSMFYNSIKMSKLDYESKKNDILTHKNTALKDLLAVKREYVKDVDAKEYKARYVDKISGIYDQYVEKIEMSTKHSLQLVVITYINKEILKFERELDELDIGSIITEDHIKTVLNYIEPKVVQNYDTGLIRLDPDNLSVVSALNLMASEKRAEVVGTIESKHAAIQRYIESYVETYKSDDNRILSTKLKYSYSTIIANIDIFVYNKRQFFDSVADKFVKAYKLEIVIALYVSGLQMRVLDPSYETRNLAEKINDAKSFINAFNESFKTYVGIGSNAIFNEDALIRVISDIGNVNAINILLRRSGELVVGGIGSPLKNRIDDITQDYWNHASYALLKQEIITYTEVVPDGLDTELGNRYDAYMSSLLQNYELYLKKIHMSGDLQYLSLLKSDNINLHEDVSTWFVVDDYLNSYKKTRLQFVDKRSTISSKFISNEKTLFPRFESYDFNQWIVGFDNKVRVFQDFVKNIDNAIVEQIDIYSENIEWAALNKMDDICNKLLIKLLDSMIRVKSEYYKVKGILNRKVRTLTIDRVKRFLRYIKTVSLGGVIETRTVDDDTEILNIVGLHSKESSLKFLSKMINNFEKVNNLCSTPIIVVDEYNSILDTVQDGSISEMFPVRVLENALINRTDELVKIYGNTTSIMSDLLDFKLFAIESFAYITAMYVEYYSETFHDLELNMYYNETLVLQKYMSFYDRNIQKYQRLLNFLIQDNNSREDVYREFGVEYVNIGTGSEYDAINAIYLQYRQIYDEFVGRLTLRVDSLQSEKNEGIKLKQYYKEILDWYYRNVVVRVNDTVAKIDSRNKYSEKIKSVIIENAKKLFHAKCSNFGKTDGDGLYAVVYSSGYHSLESKLDSIISRNNLGSS